jgi:hypothetical protein
MIIFVLSVKVGSHRDGSKSNYLVSLICQLMILETTLLRVSARSDGKEI